MRKLSYLLAATVVMIAAGLGLGLYFGHFSKQGASGNAPPPGTPNTDDYLEPTQNSTDIPDPHVNVTSGPFTDGFMDILGTDPFAGRVGINGTVFRWVGTTGKGGLTLDVFNALDDTWQRFFVQAISDWDSGTPDALNLSTTQTTPESSCDQVDGVMKVCNGNYGDTGWRGINEIILTSANTIVSSVVKMNEFFLTNHTSDLDKQYAMCHEIGHGFGLAHTDENFLNSPLGDCLDYSNSVMLNQKPGQINFEKLVTAYGEIRFRRQRRNRQISGISKATRSRVVLIPELAKKTFGEKVLAFQLGIENEGWTLLHQHKFGEIHSIEMGGGYRGHINILLA